MFINTWDNFMNKTVSIVVPHGDDEVLAFGGVIQKHVKNGDNVDVIFARKAIDDRTKVQVENIKDAHKVLGYRNHINMGFSEIEMSHEPLKFFRSLEGILNNTKPDIVYTMFWADIHQDHKIVFDWVCRAVRPHGPLKVKEFYVGETPSSTDQRPYIIGDNFKPNYYVQISEEELNTKVKALECYLTENCKYPHPRSSEGIISKAKIRGQECNSFYAEAFMCLRHIV